MVSGIKWCFRRCPYYASRHKLESQNLDFFTLFKSLTGSSYDCLPPLLLAPSEILDWPKHLFGFFCNRYGKTQMNFLANQYLEKCLPS